MPGGGLLRLYIDSPDGISVDDCERVSRAVSETLDAADPIASEYTLEVSSPGLDRVLRTREHFARFAGERVRARDDAAGQRAQAVRGSADGSEASDEITLEVDGARCSLPIAWHTQGADCADIVTGYG